MNSYITTLETNYGVVEGAPRRSNKVKRLTDRDEKEARKKKTKVSIISANSYP